MSACPSRTCLRPTCHGGDPAQSLATAKDWVRQVPAMHQAGIGLFQLLAGAEVWHARQQQLRWRGVGPGLGRGRGLRMLRSRRCMERELVLAGRMMPLMLGPGSAVAAGDLCRPLQMIASAEPGQAAATGGALWRLRKRCHRWPYRWPAFQTWLADAGPAFWSCLEVHPRSGYAVGDRSFNCGSLCFGSPRPRCSVLLWQSRRTSQWNDGTAAWRGRRAVTTGSQHSEEALSAWPAHRMDGQRRVRMRFCGQTLAGWQPRETTQVLDISHIAFDTAGGGSAMAAKLTQTSALAAIAAGTIDRRSADTNRLESRRPRGRSVQPSWRRLRHARPLPGCSIARASA